MTKRKDEFTFERTIERLHEILESLDSESTSLDASIHLYDEGISLMEKCVEELATKKKLVKELRKRTDGLFELLDIAEEE